MRLRLKTLRAGWGPVGGEVEIKPRDRELLNPLFELLRDRRSLLHPSHGRIGEAQYVTESIKAIREELTSTLQQLQPDSAARSWVEKLRAACREYLTAVQSSGLASVDQADFEPALAQLRSSFFIVANHAAAYYRLAAARELAAEMAANRDVRLAPEIDHDPAHRDDISPIQFFESLPPDEQATWTGLLEHMARVVTDQISVASPQYRAAKQLCHHRALEHVDWRGGYELFRITDRGGALLRELKRRRV